MNIPNATIRINIDPANPGQFFACCGLLELADRLWRGTEGWFEQREFCMAIPGVEDESKALDKLLREAHIVFGAPFNITLDWFADVFTGGSRFKTWAGRQSVLDIAASMKEVLKGTEWRHEDCLTFSACECGLLVSAADQRRPPHPTPLSIFRVGWDQRATRAPAHHVCTLPSVGRRGLAAAGPTLRHRKPRIR